MPLNSKQILTALRGSVTGKSPFIEGSLGAYLTDNFGAPQGKKNWVIECSNPPLVELSDRRLPQYWLGMYHNVVNPSLRVENNRTDLVTQGYSIGLFKTMAKGDGYDEEEEFLFYDLGDAVLDWVNTTLSEKLTTITADSNGCPTLYNFFYTSQSKIVRDVKLKYIYQELNFQALRQMRLNQQ